MTRSHPGRRAALGLTVATVVVALLTGVHGGAVLAAEDPAEGASGKTPKPVKGLDLYWYTDQAESKQDGATMLAYGDMVAVGVAVGEGNGKVRKQLVKQGGKKDTAIGPATKAGKKDTVATVVVNLAGKIPGKLNSDVVLVVGADGADSVPFSVTEPESLTQGSAFAHVIGRYGSQQGSPWLTGDDTLAGDGPGSVIDFGRQGTGAGGYDAKTKSVYTSFILPPGAHNLHVALYTTKGGNLVTDVLTGPAHTNRIPVPGMAVDPFACAKLEVFGRADVNGPTGVYDVRVALEQTLNGSVLGSPFPLAFATDPPASAMEAFPPESPSGSGITYWQGTVDMGSPDGGVFEVVAPGAASGVADGGPLPAVLNAFGGVRVHATPNGSGTAFGDHRCGSVFQLEGCTAGGGADFWADFAEAAGLPRPTEELEEFPFTSPLGTAYCVLVPVGQEQPYAVFGIEPRPFTLDGHERDMEANACDQTPVDIGFGGVMADCPAAARTYRWLETGVDPTPGAEPGWGFRPEFSIWPAGRDALGWSDDIVPLTPQAYQTLRQEALALLAEVGFPPEPEGYDFRADTAAARDSSDDLIAD